MLFTSIYTRIGKKVNSKMKIFLEKNIYLFFILYFCGIMITRKFLFIVCLYFWVIQFSFAQKTISCDIDSIDLEEAYLDSAFNAEKIGDYLSAVKYAEKCVMVSKDTANIIDDGLFFEYNFLVEFYAKAGMWDKALRLQKRRVDYWENEYKESAQNEYAYFMMFRLWTQLLSLSGAHKVAIREITNFINVTKLNQIYIDGITSDIADCYYNIRDYHKAQQHYEKVGNKYGIAKSLAAQGDYQKAIVLMKELIEDRQKRNYIVISLDIEQENGPYDTYLCDLAAYFNKTEQYDSALTWENKHQIPSRFEMARSYYNIGEAYAGKNQLDSAIYYINKAKEIYRIQRQNRQYSITLSKLLSYYTAIGIQNEAELYASDLVQSARTDLISSFSDLTYAERSKYVELYSNLLGENLLKFTYNFPTDKLISLTYDALLLTKGALLNSEYSIKRVINESNDANLTRIWEELCVNRYILEKQLRSDSHSKDSHIDSLQNVIYSLEDSLLLKCKDYGILSKSMNLKWNDIQKELSKEDIAIEFLQIPINKDSVIYAALTLRRDSNNPELTLLFDEKKLKLVSDTLYYQCDDMTNLVWTPLQPELEGIKNIYFSPSGALYNIGIEYLPGMEDYNIYRLSSTRELVNKKDMNVNNRAVLYGGLDYYAPIDTPSSTKSPTITNEPYKERANVRGMGLRGGKEYLKHTKIEVDRIGEELNKAKWICMLDTASLGTEESFKRLSGRKNNIMHIATHGFYYTKEEADNISYQFMLLDNQKVSAEDKALTRTGLIMSGANHILEGEELPDNVEDGILTAKEIADVDLRELDLVVLSACQTGLGDISQGEGVFGLQRGFKKAGANSILMSLWEVNDEATQILMTQFYKNLVSGQSKRQSLQSAQRYLREYNAGQYDKPEYWAAFILLDGIEKN